MNGNWRLVYARPPSFSKNKKKNESNIHNKS
nr:MAG TPA: hypothetical protein [Caudoviricetes sp.]